MVVILQKVIVRISVVDLFKFNPLVPMHKQIRLKFYLFYCVVRMSVSLNRFHKITVHSKVMCVSSFWIVS